MGDMADWTNEQGEDEYIRHLTDNCIDGYCPYCADETSPFSAPKARKRPRKNTAKKEADRDR